MTILWPSTHPSSRSPCRNAPSRDGLSEGDVNPRKPIRGTLPACCCPRAASGHAAVAPPRSVMKSRRRIASLGLGAPTSIKTGNCGQRNGQCVSLQCGKTEPRMSLMGQTRPSDDVRCTTALPPKADVEPRSCDVANVADCVAKVFLAFGRKTLIQDRARTSNNDSKEPTLRFDCYKFLFHRACLATFATQSAISGCEQPQQQSLFDHLVGAGEQTVRHGEAERLGRVEV